MQKTQNKNTDSMTEQMFQTGAHYGYSKSRRHPSVASYIYTTKNKTDIIDLEKTSIQLTSALDFIKDLGAKGKTILFVGTKPEAKDSIISSAMSLGMPFVAERWIGGTLSNYKEIKKRIAELENYHKDQSTGKLEKYTKKERLLMAKKIEKLSKYYSGLINLKKTPDALFIVDAKAENIASDEAFKMNVPIIALLNSDSNIRNITYPIIGNDSSTSSIAFFVSTVAEAYKAGKNSAPPTTTTIK